MCPKQVSHKFKFSFFLSFNFVYVSSVNIYVSMRMLFEEIQLYCYLSLKIIAKKESFQTFYDEMYFEKEAIKIALIMFIHIFQEDVEIFVSIHQILLMYSLEIEKKW